MTPARSLPLALLLWASSYLGCAAFVLAGVLPRGPFSVPLLGQLTWLALLGSVPTTLLLAAASRTSRSGRRIVLGTAAAVALLALTVGWEHTGFLLSGPRWALHPQRGLIRLALNLLLGGAASAAWLWVVLGMRLDARRELAVWGVVTLLTVAVLGDAMIRFRAYDYFVAQLLLPAGTLCAALVFVLLGRLPYRRAAVTLAALFALLGAGTRLTPAAAATGQREMIAHSRAGALASSYVLPHLPTEQAWAPSTAACPDVLPSIETAPLPMDPARRRNVLIITVDALRKDVIGAARREAPVTPELSRLETEGVAFQNATSTYPATLFAIGSAFTGLSPTELYLAPALPETIFTRAAAHTDSQFAILPDVSWFRLPIVERFLAAGLDPVFVANDAAATRASIQHLQAARAEGSSVMGWIHYYAPHDPYRARRPFPFGAGKRNAYLSEVAAFDRELGRLLDYLKKDGWLEDSLVVFFSDHGEALGEEGYWGHHVYLNGWMTDIPLVLWHAALPPARPTVGVSLVDVAPTVLHFLGLPAPSNIAATSLLALDPNAKDRPTFSEAFPVRGRALFDSFLLPAFDDTTIRNRLRGIRRASKGYEPKASVTLDRHRLVRHRSANTMLLYERAAHAGEALVQDAATEAALRAELERWEREQLRRIECRLHLRAKPLGSSDPR